MCILKTVGQRLRKPSHPTTTCSPDMQLITFALCITSSLSWQGSFLHLQAGVWIFEASCLEPRQVLSVVLRFCFESEFLHFSTRHTKIARQNPLFAFFSKMAYYCNSSRLHLSNILCSTDKSWVLGWMIVGHCRIRDISNTRFPRSFPEKRGPNDLFCRWLYTKSLYFSNNCVDRENFFPLVIPW